MKHHLIALAMVLGIAGHGHAQIGADDIAVCRAAPSAVCLADIGFALGTTGAPLPRVSLAPAALAQMGRVNDAEALMFQIQVQNGATEARAREFADWSVSDFRVVEALREGAEIAVALERPGKPDRKLGTALARLAGMWVSTNAVGPAPNDDPDDRALIRRAAIQAAGQELDAPEAASLLAYIGEEDAARAILLSPSAADAEGSFLSNRLVRLIGVERTLDLYEARGSIRPVYYRALIEEAPDSGRALALIEEMVALAEQAEDDRLLWNTLSSAARHAHELGENERSATFVDRLWRAHEADPEAFADHVGTLAFALVREGGREGEVRALLAQAEARRLTYTMKLQRDASAKQLARLYARLGDGDAAARLIGETDGSIGDWSAAIQLSEDPVTRRALFDAARRSLSDDAYTMLRAETARLMASPTQTPALNAAANRIAWDLVEGIGKIEVSRLSGFAVHLLRVAHVTGDRDLESLVLSRSAQRALDERDPEALIILAYQFELLGGG